MMHHKRADTVLIVIAVVFALAGVLALTVVVATGLEESPVNPAWVAVSIGAPPAAMILMIVLWIRMIAYRRRA